MKLIVSFTVAAVLLDVLTATTDAFVITPKFSAGNDQHRHPVLKNPSMGMTSSSPSEEATSGGRVMGMQPDGFGEWMMPSNNGKDYNEYANPYMYHARAYRYHFANDGGYLGQTEDMERRTDAMNRFKYSPLGNRRTLPSYTREEFSRPSFHLAQNDELMWKYQDERNFIENPRGTNLRGYSGWRW